METTMSDLLFSNATIFDATGAQPYLGEVLVRGNRIVSVTPLAAPVKRESGDVTVIDATGKFLMPGMTESHTHFSWNDQPSLNAIAMMPPEEHILWCMQVAKIYLEMGWTSCMGAAAAKPRLDVVVRNAINSGAYPGPRYSAASQEITVQGGLGDTIPPHMPYPELSFCDIISGVEEMRRSVRQFIKYGVDTVKLNLSGEYIAGISAQMTPFSDEEIAVAAAEVKRFGKRLAAHARSAESIKQCLRHGIEIIYHGSYADEEALDMLEKHKGQYFFAPGLAWLIETAYNAGEWGLTPEVAKQMGYVDELEHAVETLKAMNKRGIPILPGGDYGFAWIPHGTNAKDLQYFTEMIGITPMDALLSATREGGKIMLMGDELGQIKENYLADILLIDGNPLEDIRVLQDKEKIVAVMKDGEFYKNRV